MIPCAKVAFAHAYRSESLEQCGKRTKIVHKPGFKREETGVPYIVFSVAFIVLIISFTLSFWSKDQKQANMYLVIAVLAGYVATVTIPIIGRRLRGPRSSVEVRAVEVIRGLGKTQSATDHRG